MTSGFRFARAEYSAAVSPAGPEPMMTTLPVCAHVPGRDGYTCLSMQLLQRVLVGQADDLLDDLAALEEQQRRNAADAEAPGRARIVVDVQLADA